MSAQWKPGDVALVRISADFPPEVAVSGDHQWFVAGPRLGSQHGWYHDRVEVIRPLVVIDPEDREQVERLAKAWHVQPGVLPWDECDERDKADSVNSLQAALREFANPTPPRPEEPTGLGAVVRDRIGQMWTRTDDAHYPWFYAAARFTYADIDAVEVLSEGVTNV